MNRNMKMNRTFWIWLGVLFALQLTYGVFLAVQFEGLPDRIATHFNRLGNPDDWMSREAAHNSFIFIGLGLSVFVVGIGYVIRYCPSKYLNVPKADYWRSEEHYPRACDFIFKMMIIFSMGMLCFMAVVFYEVIQANQHSPVILNHELIEKATLALFVGLGVWVIFLYRFFKK